MSFDGDISLPLLGLSGTTGMECELPIPVISMSGTFGSSGSLVFPVIKFAGKTQDIINGSISLHWFEIAGEIGVSSKIDGSLNVPRFSIAGNMQADCEIVLQSLRIIGTLQVQGIIVSTVNIPVIRVLGSISVLGSIDGNFSLPAAEFAGVMTSDVSAKITGDFNIPIVQIVGVVIDSSSYDYSLEEDAVLQYITTRRYL